MFYSRFLGPLTLTTPLRKPGFPRIVRISSNPSFTADAVSPAEALALLDEITALREHQFWPDDLSLSEAMNPDSYFSSHRQITDAYLAALAASRSGKLATLDRAVAGQAVEFIGSHAVSPRSTHRS